jgi:hypothetical protein
MGQTDPPAAGLPGVELVAAGLKDLAARRRTVPVLLLPRQPLG